MPRGLTRLWNSIADAYARFTRAVVLGGGLEAAPPAQQRRLLDTWRDVDLPRGRIDGPWTFPRMHEAGAQDDAP